MLSLFCTSPSLRFLYLSLWSLHSREYSMVRANIMCTVSMRSMLRMLMESLTTTGWSGEPPVEEDEEVVGGCFR